MEDDEDQPLAAAASPAKAAAPASPVKAAAPAASPVKTAASPAKAAAPASPVKAAAETKPTETKTDGAKPEEQQKKGQKRKLLQSPKTLNMAYLLE